MSDFKESEHPRDSDGKFTDSDFFGGEEKGEAKEDFFEEKGIENKKKMTPAEKIASVHIDFDKDNILPELNDDTLKKLNKKEGKKVLLKKSIIERNTKEHSDLTMKDFEQIIGQALYDAPEVFPANRENPNYYHLASIVEITSKDKPEIGLVLLDIDDNKEHFEIVHAHYVRKRSYNRLKNKQ